MPTIRVSISLSRRYDPSDRCDPGSRVSDLVGGASTTLMSTLENRNVLRPRNPGAQ